MRSQVVDKDDAIEGDLFFEEDGSLHGKGIVRTDEQCTNCDKTFVMKVDFSLNGNHVMVCPHCGHQHCRVIVNGEVTGDRWDSRWEAVEIPQDSIWSDTNVGAKTSAAFQHIREKWFGRMGDE